MYAFPQPQDIVINLVVVFTELLENDDMLVALLFSVTNGFNQIDIGRFVIFDEVLLSVLNDAVGTKGHEALHVTAEVGEKLGWVISTEYFFDFCGLRHRGVLLLQSRHNR